MGRHRKHLYLVVGAELQPLISSPAHNPLATMLSQSEKNTPHSVKKTRIKTKFLLALCLYIAGKRIGDHKLWDIVLKYEQKLNYH